MPQLDGLAATRAIRDEKFGASVPQVPIIAMTASAMPDDRALCLEAGMDDFLTKPVTAAAVADLLDTWLDVGEPSWTRPDAVPSSTPPPAPARAVRASDARAERSSEAPVYLDRALLDRTMGDSALAEIVIAGFLEDLPLQLRALTGFVEAGDAAGAERQAHTLRGAAAVVGAEALSRAAHRLEVAGAAGELAALREGLPSLRRDVERLVAAIRSSVVVEAEANAEDDEEGSAEGDGVKS